MYLFGASNTAKSQADGAQIIELEADDHFFRHQIQVEVSATPTAGTLTVAGKTPNGTEFIDLAPAINLTAGAQLYSFTGYYAAIRLTPAALDADKTYSAYYVAGRG
ncbi:MAG: hypothetical protein P1P81_04445 [Desulfobulbales bacterium]|nr:hypothetical protein [Desulfobulbales bacterium]